MTGRMQAVCATCLAALLHLGMFAAWSGTRGAESAGGGGEARLSLHAVDADLASKVVSWDTPPDVSVDPAMMPVPYTTEHETMPVRRQTDAAVVSPPAAAPGLPTPPRETVPLPDSTPPAAPPARADGAVAKAADTSPPPDRPLTPPATRPKARPDRLAPPADRAVTPRDAASPASGQAAERAAGDGQTEQAGQASSDHTTVRDTAQHSDLIAQWGASIRNRVERRKTYPAAAGRAGGRVLLTLTVNRNGQLVDVALSGSSGYAALDGAAIRAVQAAGRFPAAPAGLSAVQYSFSLPVSFSR